MTKTYSTNGIDYEIRVGTNGDKAAADVFRKVHHRELADVLSAIDAEEIAGISGIHLLVQECEKYLDNNTP